MHLSGRKKGREERRRKWEWEKEEKREGERKRMKKKMKAGGRRMFYCEFLPVVMTTEIRVWGKMWKGERTAPNLPGRGKTTWGEDIEVRSKFSKLKKELRNLKDKKAIWMVGEVRRHDDVCFLGHWSFSISWTRQKKPLNTNLVIPSNLLCLFVCVWAFTSCLSCPQHHFYPFLKSRTSSRKDCEFSGYLGLLKYYPLFLLHQVPADRTLFIHFLLENVLSIWVHCLSQEPCSPGQCPDFIVT